MQCHVFLSLVCCKHCWDDIVRSLSTPAFTVCPGAGTPAGAPTGGDTSPLPSEGVFTTGPAAGDAYPLSTGGVFTTDLPGKHPKAAVKEDTTGAVLQAWYMPLQSWVNFLDKFISVS